MRESGQTSGALKVTSRCEGDRVLVEVTDTGPGIPPEQLARIFEPFFTTKPVGVGTGLGLSTCQEIVTWHGGELRVRSVVGEGTSFKISLPALQQQPADAPHERAPAAPRATIEGRPGRPRLLLIDDEVAICRSVVRALREYAVVTANSGPEALTILEADRAFDLVICDVVMPEMSGVDLFREISAAHPQLAERFVFITGSVGYANVRGFASELAIPVLEKPFSIASIRELIEKNAP
jgi:CheY-like chemotaxis protein